MRFSEGLPPLPTDPSPLVLDQVGDVDGDEGIRVSLLPSFLLIEVNTPSGHGYIRIPTDTLLDALVKQCGGQA